MSDPKRFLRQLKNNLNILRERAAKYASNTPLHLLNQIEDHEQAIKFTEQFLQDKLSETEWQDQLKPLLLAIKEGLVVNLEIEGYFEGDKSIHEARFEQKQQNVRNQTNVAGDVQDASVTGNKVDINVYYDPPATLPQTSTIDTGTEPPAPGEPPFKGLEYFEVEDAPLFFGREKLTAEIIGHLHKHRFLAVVGDSGSGKSSVIRAGVISTLKNRTPLVDGKPLPTGSHRWQVHIITPTDHPIEALAAKLTPKSEPIHVMRNLMASFLTDPEALHLTVRRLISDIPASQRCLLIVDQFEELFTLCDDPALRHAFIDNLMTAANKQQGPTYVILIVRSDFYGQFAQFENLRNEVVPHQVLMGPMQESELRQIIEAPVNKNEWGFETGLVEKFLEDVENEPGALPLLSHALLKIWEDRQGRLMTWTGYHKTGGIKKAIAQTAENIYKDLEPEQQDIARNHIFLRLIKFDKEGRHTRKRIAKEQLLTNSKQKTAIETVLNTLIEARLITVRGQDVEIAHEALIRNWPSLQGWLEQDREALRNADRINEDALEWRKNGRDSSYLYQGNKLDKFLALLQFHSRLLNNLSREFLETAEVKRDQEHQEKEAQERRKKEIQAEREKESRKRAAERLQRLELLQQVNELIAEAGRDPQVLDLIAQTANEISGGKQTNIYLYDATIDRFTGGVRVFQDGRVEQVETSNLPGPDGLAMLTAQKQEAIFVENVKNYSGPPSTFATQHNVQAYVGVPLTIAHRHLERRITVGVLFVYFTEPRPFSDDYKELLQHLANQAAAAIYAGIQESALAKEQLAALGTAAAALQHRLSNTINGFIPAVMRLRLRDEEDETYQGILDTIQRNVNFATEVIQRMQAPLRQEDFVKTNIGSLLSSAIAKCCQEDDRFSQIRIATDLPDISASTGSEIDREIFIKTDIDPELPETYACIGQLTEVFRVLVENAIKAIYPQTGTITIICRLKRRNPQTRVEITVQDTGSGIDKETQRRLFRQPIPRQELGEGAGLGLWLSQIIIRNHQGEITLHETKINEGSIFVVSLPILSDPPLSYALQQGDLY